MQLFRQRNTPVENITFIGVASALVALFALASSFSVIASLALMLVLPLLSSLVAMICKWRYIPLYLVSSIILSTLLSFASFQNEILFVVPSLLLGVAYGMLEKSKLSRALSLFLCAILEFGLFYLGMAAIRGFYEIDMQAFLLRLIGRDTDPVAGIIFPTFVLAYSYAQIAITHLVFVFAFSRFALKDKLEWLRPWYPLISVALYTMSLIFAFIQPALAYFFMGLSLYWTVFTLMSFFRKPLPIPIVLLVSGIFITWILVGALYQLFPAYTGLVLYGIFFLFVDFARFLNDLLLRKKKESTINP